MSRLTILLRLKRALGPKHTFYLSWFTTITRSKGELNNHITQFYFGDLCPDLLLSCMYEEK